MGLATFIEKSAVNLGLAEPTYAVNDDVFSLANLQKSETWRLVDNVLKGLDVVPAEGDLRAFAQCYSTLVWVYVSGWIISSSIGDVPLRLYSGNENDTDKAKAITDGKVYDLLRKPNPLESGVELREDLALFLELTGMGYWEKYGIVGNLPVKLFNLEPYNVKIKAHPTEKIDYYLYDIGDTGQAKKFLPQQIAQFKYSNPNSIFYGQGAIKALQMTLITELYRESYNKSFFENEARPDLIIKHNPDIVRGIAPLDDETRRAFANRWRNAFGGPKRARLPVLLESGMDVSILSEARRDAEFLEMEKSLREKIFAAFGVPPAMAGIYEYANYANSKEQIHIFWTTTIPPKCRRIASTINRAILQPYDEKLWCKFDLDIIPALEETPKEKEERLSRMLERGGITIGRYAAELGYKEDFEQQDKRVIASNLIPLEDAFAPPVEEEPFQPGEGGFPEETSPAFQPGKTEEE